MNTTTTITLSDHAVNLLSLKEVAEQLMNPRIDRDEFIGDVGLSCDNHKYLNVCVRVKCEDDKRCTDYLSYTETFTLEDIRTDFCEGADYCTWAKDENGDDVLACFGNY